MTDKIIAELMRLGYSKDATVYDLISYFDSYMSDVCTNTDFVEFSDSEETAAHDVLFDFGRFPKGMSIKAMEFLVNFVVNKHYHPNGESLWK